MLDGDLTTENSGTRKKGNNLGQAPSQVMPLTCQSMSLDLLHFYSVGAYYTFLYFLPLESKGVRFDCTVKFCVVSEVFEKETLEGNILPEGEGGRGSKPRLSWGGYCVCSLRNRVVDWVLCTPTWGTTSLSSMLGLTIDSYKPHISSTKLWNCQSEPSRWRTQRDRYWKL